jgi:geranylgeranyl diphosphate synthase type II
MARPRSAPFDLPAYLADCTTAVNRALDRWLPAANARPATLHQAMRHPLFAGGKRIRPALCLAAAEACGGRRAAALPAACAVECIHTYSLVHDDLPCMDDDDLRRGQPTTHVRFRPAATPEGRKRGEAIALLAGDALLTHAFELLARAPGTVRYPHRVLVRELAVAAGSRQLIGGQMADLEGEGRRLDLAALRFIHERKTSALLACAARLGGMSANCSPAQLRALTAFGRHVGLAFQVLDDILDVTQSSDRLGKTAGKDVKAQKATYPALLGLEASRREAARLTRRAFAALEIFGPRGAALAALAEFLLHRES